jgi:ribonuclease HII
MIIGIDEVGRGAWAGPMVVGAVAFDDDYFYKDSKVITSQAREIFDKEIRSRAVFCELGWVTSEEIDRWGLTRATTEAIKRAINKAPSNADFMIDGAVNYLPGRQNVSFEPRADATYSNVAAASIIAKVARDNYMKQLSKQYPQYGFDTHVGYGTPKHKTALKRYGVTNVHRTSYKSIKDILK